VPDRQKVVANVAGTPFLSILIDSVYKQGFRQFVLCAGYLSEQIEQLDRARWKEAEFTISVEKNPLGTAGALKLVEPHLRSEHVLVLNGDSYFDIAYRQLVLDFLKRDADLSVAVREVPDTTRYGRVSFNSDCRITAFEEKVAGAGPEARAGYINAGIYVVKRELINGVPANRAVSLERECLPNWLSLRCFAFPGSGKFIDIGTPEDYAKAQSLFKI